MTILVGTASWTDKTLIDSGKFYPAEARSPEARLRYYTQQFPMVEVDASYYAIPTATTAQAWAERTPPEFTFNVKAFRLLLERTSFKPVTAQRAPRGAAVPPALSARVCISHFERK